MKKLLVLMLILGLTGIASAALIEVEVVSKVGNDYNLKVVVAAGHSCGMYALQITTSAGTLFDNATTVQQVTPQYVAYYSGISANAIAKVSDFNFMGGWTGDLVWDFGVTLASGTALVVVTPTLLGDATSVDGGIIGEEDMGDLLIPEPMTIALLGLGGLFLRRRR